jgi:hypothetical protein
VSTKIYSGFIVDNVTNLSELGAWLTHARETFEPARKRVIEQEVSRLACCIHVAACVSRNESEFVEALSHEGESARYLADQLYNENRKLSHTLKSLIGREWRDEELSFLPFMSDCALQLFFTPDNKLLGFKFGNRWPIVLEEWFDSLNGVRFYGYWDNVDPDENCTEQEWRQRKEDWEILGYEPIGECGLRFDPCVKWVDFIDIAHTADGIAAYWPEHKESFITSMIRNKIFNREGGSSKAREKMRDANSALNLEFKNKVRATIETIPDITSAHFKRKFLDVYGDEK